ncbi:MAG: class I SAM-dependent methyltransferase [Vicinamibacterales bacterium]
MTATGVAFSARLSAALHRRATLAGQAAVTAWRVLDGEGDGVPGMFVDRYGPAAVMSVYDDARMSEAGVTAAAAATLEALAPLGVEGVYVKRFVRDRSRLGGAPDESRSAMPRAGRPVPEALVVEECGVRYEVRPYDGLSTGLFLDLREHRRALARLRPERVLNLFAYTCAFAMPLALAGARVTCVDVSARYLEWGRRSLALNGVAPSAVRFLRRDARDVLTQAARRPDARFDLVILDPPTFGAADRRRHIAAWRAVDHYGALVQAAAAVVAPGGRLFAATNTRELAAEGVLPALVSDALGRPPRWLPLPPWPADVTAPGRVAALLCAP